MTQDAPLDQSALDAAIRAVSSGTFVNTPGGAENVARVAIRAYLAALSRRVPASGGEVREALPEPTPGMLADAPENMASWLRAFGCAVAKDGSDAQRIEAIARRLAASPIVAAPEGWRRAFLAYVEPEDAFTQLAIALCRADGNNPDATVSVDGGPMQRHWHYYAEEARTMLLAAAPSIPEGKAEPLKAGYALYLEYVDKRDQLMPDDPKRPAAQAAVEAAGEMYFLIRSIEAPSEPNNATLGAA